MSSNDTKTQLSFVQHLEVLRWHLVKCVLSIIILAIVLFCLNDLLFDTIIFGPLNQNFFTYKMFCKLGQFVGAGNDLCINIKVQHLQTLSASEQFFTHMWIAILGGLILSIPYILFQLWQFIKPALKQAERKGAVLFVFTSSTLFMIGILFGYFLLFPMSYSFLINYQLSSSGIVQTNNTLSDYISLISTMTFVSGLIFELPIVVYFLSKLSILSPFIMRKYRKYAVVIILIVSAIITPSPDVTSQLIVAIPIYILYEVSIFISSYVHHKK